MLAALFKGLTGREMINQTGFRGRYDFRMGRILPIISLISVTGLWAQTVPKFEVADVHRGDRAMNPFTFVSGGVLLGERYDLRKATMLDLIRIAYNVDPETVEGGPNWLEFDRFDIAAKASASSSPEQVRMTLQSLLADRFKLVLHEDVRPIPAFVLGAGKTKPKMNLSDGTGEAGCQYEQQPAGSAVIAYACPNITMAAFTERLRACFRLRQSSSHQRHRARWLVEFRTALEPAVTGVARRR